MADAVPVPTSAVLQAVIASFMVLPASWLSAHFVAAPVLIFQFLSRKIWVRSTAPPGLLLPGFV